MARIFHYSGDRSIEHGGMFYCLDSWQWGYVEAFRVVPCSDAGGPDNLFWLEELTINIRKPGPELDSILQCCGFDADKLRELSRANRRHAIIESHVAYGAYDLEQSIMIQIGPDDPFSPRHVRAEFKPQYRLRASVSLRKLARRMAGGLELSACVKPLERAQ